MEILSSRGKTWNISNNRLQKPNIIHDNKGTEQMTSLLDRGTVKL